MALDYGNWAATGDEDASFDKAPFDNKAAQEKMVARITRTMKQLNGETVSKQGGKDFDALHNNGVVYRPTLNSHPIKLPGVSEDGLRISRSALKAKLPTFASDVEAGHFDDQLEAAMTSGGTNKLGLVRPASTSTGTGKPRTEISKVRSSVVRYVNAGKSLDEVEKLLKSGTKFTEQDIDAVIAEKRAEA